MPRSRQSFRRVSLKREQKLIVIATEDTEATVRYFDELAKTYRNPKSR